MILQQLMDRSISTSPGWNASPWYGCTSTKFADICLYTQVARGAVGVQCLSQNPQHIAVPKPEHEPRSFDLQPSVLNHQAIAPPTILIKPDNNSRTWCKWAFLCTGSILLRSACNFSFTLVLQFQFLAGSWQVHGFMVLWQVHGFMASWQVHGFMVGSRQVHGRFMVSLQVHGRFMVSLQVHDRFMVSWQVHDFIVGSWFHGRFMVGLWFRGRLMVSWQVHGFMVGSWFHGRFKVRSWQVHGRFMVSLQVHGFMVSWQVLGFMVPWQVYGGFMIFGRFMHFVDFMQSW